MYLFLFYYRDALDMAVKYKDNPTDLEDQILEELDNFNFLGDKDKDDKDDKDDQTVDKQDTTDK